MEYRSLTIKGTAIEKQQLEDYLEKLASDQVLQSFSSKDTYPIPEVKENFEIIKEVYTLLNEHIKLGIPIHPAGEWLLDNFYIIEETAKTVIKELDKKKYTQFLGIQNGNEKGFARIYVLAAQIVAYTDHKINSKNLEEFIRSYQRKKTLSMDEIWNIGLFIQIALIQGIKETCEKIYFSQMQKYRVENILERLVEKKEDLKYKNLSEYKMRVKGYGEMKYPFIEYMSYRLKAYGKSGSAFLNVLEDQVNKMGTSIEEVIKKEHFDIAVKKVSMANSILSMKELLRIDFLMIFEKLNGVEDILKEDPAHVYEKMDYKTKEQYRNEIKDISKKTKISELYIAQKVLSLAKSVDEKGKKSHVGYYLIDQGREKLLQELQANSKKPIKKSTKAKWYVATIWGITIFLDLLLCLFLQQSMHQIVLTILAFLLISIPIQQIVVQVVQSILGKIVKPKLIPKLDFQNGIPEEYATFVVIPTILKSKEKVAELMKKLEVYSLANKSENLYFALLGDCSSGKNKEEPFDAEVVAEGLEQVKRLNEKYPSSPIPKFHFIYRKRFWNGKEECYLGWERKRGLLTQFNAFVLGEEESPFRVNTLEGIPLTNIRYIITLDADTELTLNTGLELIGAMAHILNQPELNEEGTAVIKGHALMQPRVGVHLDVVRTNLFTRIFAGSGGTDSYTNAISDIYQDNFEEGIFTGKGIYDIAIFSKVLKNAIPEDTVLSHDLLEGSYLRCGLVTDVMLMDGYPSSYSSFKTRLHRWIRGDFQISIWLKKNIINRKQNREKNPLNFLSRYKIFDNLIRAKFPVALVLSILYMIMIDLFTNAIIWPIMTVLFLSIGICLLLDMLYAVIGKQEGKEGKKSFEPTITGIQASFLRTILELAALPDKAYISLTAECKTMYRLWISKKHLLEWTTSEEAEKLAKTDLFSYYKNMLPNVILGVLGICYLCFIRPKQGIFSILTFMLSTLWLIAPAIFWYMSKTVKQKEKWQELKKQEQDYLYEIGQRTWQFFKDFLTEETHYLPPDNYQEDRKEKVVNRTSSTNIGLGLMAVISSYDLGYENLVDTLTLLQKMTNTIENLQKWNGHLYNWYNITTLEPLMPRYVSTVDSGNFIGYVYVLKAFYQSIKQQLEKEGNTELLSKIPEWADGTIQDIPFAQADFKTLYDEEKKLFSIGFNIETNELTDSYYDLLASEARQTSFVAIAKKDISEKHWYGLSRTLTTLNHYKGLLSWSGTAFEYLMPHINMKRYPGSLLDESCQFMIMSQKEYAKKIGIPWGFSETAFHIRDFHNNYQYKAIGIPWLGLKRGLEDDIVVTTYASAMALPEQPKEVVENLKQLEKQNMYDKYGFYESIDYTPSRLRKGEQSVVIKTYMAHHQALLLLSINNLFHQNILQQRFHANPEIGALDILLQERMPESMIITNEQKVKPEKITYKDYEDYCVRTVQKMGGLPVCNVISSGDYSIVMNERAEGYSQYQNKLVNRFKETSNEVQGIFFYLKNIRNKRIWTSHYSKDLGKPDKYEIRFTEAQNEISRMDGNIETTTTVTIASKSPVEVRKIEVKNHGVEEETLEITSVLEPVLSGKEQDYAHPAFQNLFLSYEFDDETQTMIIKRKNREQPGMDCYMAVNFYTQAETMGELEYEIDKEKFYGRGNLGLPIMVKQSRPFSKKHQLVTDPILAMKRTVSLKPEEKKELTLFISVADSKQEAIHNLEEYRNEEQIKRIFEIARARVEAENRYIGVNAKQIATFQTLLGYLLFKNPLQRKPLEKKVDQEQLWKYGISGDLPILLVKINTVNDMYVIEEVLKAYEYFQTKKVQIDLVLLDEEKNSYENYVKESILNSILNQNLGYQQNKRGGIFLLDNLKEEEKDTLYFRSTLILDAQNGGIARNLKDLEEEQEETKKEIGYELEKVPLLEEEKHIQPLEGENLKYCNEYGGFSLDGSEYLIRVNQEKRLPTIWSHIMANEKFGTLVTEGMGGFTWYRNSRLNRVTAWSNSQVVDEPSEILYLQEKDNLKTWSIGLNPMPDQNDYDVVYGFGYSVFHHISSGIDQEVKVFVPQEDSVKVNLITLKNLEPKKKKLKMVYYMKPVLGEEETKTNSFLSLSFDQNANMMMVKNLAGKVFQNVVYIASSEKIESYTGSREFFIGKGTLEHPEALKKVGLNKETRVGNNTIVAIQLSIELEAFEKKEFNILLGAEESELDSREMAYRYTNCSQNKVQLENVKRYWKEQLGNIQVKTPLESFDILMNGWLLYQTITSRLYARSAFYQSGGAFGFRDQLQDTICLKYTNPNRMKEQILKHASHQFIEGDVEHWWHEETQMGIRTRFSDDLLWLVYLVEEYIETTGDSEILEIEVPYREGEILPEGVDENYGYHPRSSQMGTMEEHCEKAIQRSLSFGEHGLPKIGSGDWNDGFSKVGPKGKGESVWLGFFLYAILKRWIPILETRKGKEEKVRVYQEVIDKLKKTLNTVGWDGRWFKRAFMDDGNELGSIQNEECRIDSISQSWATISEAGDNDKKYISLESLENHLVDRENGIIKLLDPPFEKSKLEPGYIKAYLPGTRENGGQYTHGAIWSIIAEAMLGFGDKALELFRMISPIEHSRTREAAQKYKVEPYVVAADIYGHGNLAGRGGWTWYTGSSSWMYEAGIHYILGLTIKEGWLSMNPCIPSSWKEYSLVYKYGNSVYHIKVSNPNHKMTGVESWIINGVESKEKQIRLIDDGKVYNIKVIL